MRRNQHRLLWLGSAILALLTWSPALLGQAPLEQAVAVPTDWSHHHVIFSKPGTAEQAKRVKQDPRYWQQLSRHSSATLPEAKIVGPVFESQPFHAQPGSDALFTGENGLRDGDWSLDMGTGATVGATNYPAKFSFNITTANCTNDFVVYGTGRLGSGGQASLVAYNNLYSGCSGLSLGTAANFAMLAGTTITNSGNSVVTGGNIGISPGTSLTGFPPGVLTAPAVEHLGDATAAQAQADANTAYTFYQGLAGATLIAPVMDGLTFPPGLYKASTTLSLSVGQTVTLNGSGTYIFQIGSTLEIAGTVVLSGGATAANVIWLVGSSATIDTTGIAAGDILALTSITLDSSASVTGRTIALNGAVTMIDNAVTTVHTVPAVYWAYNTGGTVNTSPVFSRDGTQIAFVHKTGSGHGTLVLVKWAASTTESIGSPTTLIQVPRASYPTCVVPCKTGFPMDDFGTLETDTNSSVFYDYDNDVAYVGDDAGFLHKFTPVFNGIPAEVTTGWPVKVNPTAPTLLNSPVYDSGSGNVFVTDKGGFLYRVDPTGVATISGQLDFSVAFDGGPGLVQGPIVDSTAGLVYVFAPSDGSGACAVGATLYDCSGVFELTTTFLAGAIGSEAIVGSSTVEPATPSPMYIGAFDSTYENSVNATGALYVCGNTGGDPVLYRVAIQAGVMVTNTPGPVLSTSFTPTPCSPVTDVLNPNVSGGATEWMFASVQNGGASTACASGGCIFNFKDTPWLPRTAYSVGQEVLDSNFHTEFVGTAGTSGASVPPWNISIAGATTDGTVHWLDLGLVSAVTPGAWVTGHHPKGSEILDPSNNIEFVTSGGTDNSGGTIPSFNPIVGGTTTDGTITWTNVGPSATAALPAAGGTSGIIMDNIVGSATEPGASQIYFSTLTNQVCGDGGTGGCAVQASQSALQ